MSPTIDFNKVTVTRLSSFTAGIDNFKNSKQEMVNHIQKDAIRDQQLKISTTWVWVYDNMLALSYISLAMQSIDRKDILRNKVEPYTYKTIPSLLIGQLATHKDYEGNGIGQSMIHWAINEAWRYSKNIGCRLVVLHPHDDVIEWYKKLKFKSLEISQRRNIMYYDLLEQTVTSDGSKIHI